MKILKLFIISVIALFLLLTVFSFLLPSRVRISRAIDISAPSEKVRRQLNDMTEWKQWNEYVKLLPATSVAADHIYSNQLNILVTNSDSASVHTAWRQQNGKSFTGVFNMIPNNSIVTVQWYFDFTFKWYPWEKFSSIVYDNLLGADMQKSLMNLKQLVENSH